MPSLLLEFSKQSHQLLVSNEHEFVVLANTLHFCLYSYYILYEVLNYMFSLLKYPRLPVLSFVRPKAYGAYTNLVKAFLMALLFVGSWEGLLGSANWKVRHTLVSCIICGPFVAVDVFLLLFGRFHAINVSDFLLFQTLLTSTIRSIRLFATIMNIAILLYIIVNGIDNTIPMIEYF